MENYTITRDNLKQIYDVACDGWKNKLQNFATRTPFQDDIELSQAEVDSMFEASDAKQTKILSKFFKRPVSLTEKIKSFNDACDHLGIDPKTVYHESDTKDEKAYKKLKVIAKALNNGWYPNWKDSNECKYFNYFRMVGNVFSCYNTYYNVSGMDVPSALCFKTSELAQHCAKIAIKEYEDYQS